MPRCVFYHQEYAENVYIRNPLPHLQCSDNYNYNESIHFFFKSFAFLLTYHLIRLFAAPKCRYSKGDWSECDKTTNKKSRTLTLKKGKKN